MTALTACDYCGTTVAERDPHLDAFGAWLLIDSGPLVNHVCSLDCLTGWLVDVDRKRLVRSADAAGLR